MDKRFVTWNVRSMYRAGLLCTLAEDISKYKLNVVGVQYGVGSEPAGKYTVTCRGGYA
jgi:hypothetical protein